MLVKQMLTRKQIQFVQEYIVDLNATQAAIRAGYSKRNSDKIASQLLGKTRVSEAIQKALVERSNRTKITADMVLQNLEEIRISSMQRIPKYDRSGKLICEDFNDKNSALKALELLGRHLAMWNNNHLNGDHQAGDIKERFSVRIVDNALKMEKEVTNN